MAETQSLADKAVDALALVKEMGADIDIKHPERHIVRHLKRLAEKALADALDHAIALAWQAKDLRAVVAEVGATASSAADASAQKEKP